MPLIAQSTEELERQIMAEMQKAMNKASKDMKKDMEWGTRYFYSGGKPRRYVRTGALGRTPTISPLITSGHELSFNAYLNKNYTYNSGDSPTMGQVLELANYGNAWRTRSGINDNYNGYSSGGGWANSTVGRQGFWEKSLERMEKTFDEAMRKYFK